MCHNAQIAESALRHTQIKFKCSLFFDGMNSRSVEQPESKQCEMDSDEII